MHPPQEGGQDREAQTWHLRGKGQNQAWRTGEHWRLLHKQSICSIRVAPQWRWLAKPSAPSFLANFRITELTERWALKPTSASEDRGLRLFTLKIKTNPKTWLYTEVSEVHPDGKASPWTPWRAALPLSLWANSTWTLACSINGTATGQWWYENVPSHDYLAFSKWVNSEKSIFEKSTQDFFRHKYPENP